MIRTAFIALCGVSALAISACAAFQAQPSASTCTKSRNELAMAQGVELLAETGLVAAQQAGASPADLTKAQNALNSANAIVGTFSQEVAINCAAFTTPPPKPPS